MTKADFFSHISGSWEDKHAEPGETRRLRAFSRYFRLRRGDRVLDVGCGSSRLVPVICDRIGGAGSLVELDFAPGMLEIGRAKPHPKNVTFILGDAQQLPLPDGGFDKVIALALLPHLEDKAAALKEFRRVLKSGGLLVIAHQLGREALDRLHGDCSEPVKQDLLPGNAALEGLLVGAGFSGIEILDEPEHYIAWAQV